MSIPETFSRKPIPLFMDYYSALPIAFIFANIVEAVHQRNYLEMGLFILTIITADIVTLGIKGTCKMAPKSLNWLLKRPIGAKNTDILSRNGLKMTSVPGFPSGHMAMVSVFSIYRLLRLYREHDNILDLIYKNPLMVIFYIGLIVIMGLVRYNKNCHNIYQILAGVLLGGIFATILDKIVRDFL